MSESDYVTRVIRRKTSEAPDPDPDPEKTRAPARTSPPPLPPMGEVDDEKTRVYHGPQSATTEASEASSGPTVGWLVIMAGPGRGNSLTLGYGMNHIGRSASNRIIIDFGDEEISRKAHTTLTYDPRGKKFYIQPGPDATNLTYIGEESQMNPVLTPTEIKGGESISLGRTKLKFIAFCDSSFSWD